MVDLWGTAGLGESFLGVRLYKAVFRHDLGMCYGVFPEFSQHSQTFSAQTHSTASNPLHYSGERKRSRVQMAEAGSDCLPPLLRSQDFLFNTQTPLSALITANSLDIFVCVFDLCVTAFFGRYLFSFSFFHFCVCESSLGSLLCSHIDFSWISEDIILGGQTEKVCRECWASHSHICVPLSKIRRNCRVQCISQSNSRGSFNFTQAIDWV